MLNCLLKFKKASDQGNNASVKCHQARMPFPLLRVTCRKVYQFCSHSKLQTKPATQTS